MCGIAGIVKYGEDPIQVDQIRLLLTGVEHRGRDATGVALQYEDGKILVLKEDDPAWDFVSSEAFDEWMEEKLTPQVTTVILHTRKATKGSPYKLANNHPMFSGKAAVVHNGHIYNDDDLFKEMKLERGAETDSDIIRAIVDKEGLSRAALRHLGRMRGAAAIACLHPDYPRHLLLGRSSSPLVLGSTDKWLVFASEKHAIHRAMRPWVKRFGVWFQQQSLDMAFSTMADNSIWLLGPEGLLWHDKFETAQWHSTAKAKQEERQTVKAEPVVTLLSPAKVNCPKCKLEVAIPRSLRTLPLWKIVHGRGPNDCGASLAERPEGDADDEAEVAEGQLVN